MRRPRRIAAAGIALALIAAGTAAAAFTDSLSSTGSVSTGTLAAPANLASTHPNATGASAGQANLTWTASTSAFVAGHRVDWSTSESGPWTTLATLGPAATSQNDATAPYNGERFYRIQAFRNNWTADSPVLSVHSRPMSAGTDRVSGSGAGTALTGPWTTAGTQLAAVSVADGTRYQPTAWPAAPATMLGVFYLDATHAWSSGTGTIAAFDGTNWVSQNPGVAVNLEQIMFASTTIGWSVGASGTIVATTNGGTTWTAQTSGTTRNLRDIDCASTTACWTVGSNGTILATTNGGTLWLSQLSLTTQQLWDIDCVSATTCWTVGNGGTILKTTNGGTIWTAQTSGVSTALRGISCLDASRCWAVGDSGVIRVTSNGGTTWTGLTSGTAQNLNGIFMVDGSVGYLIGAGTTVRKTVNGGTSWTAQTVPTAAYQSVSCISTTACLIVSDLGAILATKDGGLTWGEQASRYVELTPLTPNLATGGAVTAVNARFVYRTTSNPGAGTRFILIASADAGTNWATFDLPTPAAANTDVTATVELSPLGFSPTSRAQNIKYRFAAIPQGGTLTVQMDLAHLDVN